MPSWCSGTILVGGFFCWKTLTFSLYKHYTVAALKYSPVHILKIICIIAADKNPTMHSRVCKYNTCLCDILNGEFGFSSLSCDSSDGSGQMVSLQRFNCWHTHTKKCQHTWRWFLGGKKWNVTTSCRETLPSVTSKLSRKSSSNLMRARASWEEKTSLLCYTRHKKILILISVLISC